MHRHAEHAGAGVRWLAALGGIAVAAALGVAAWPFLFQDGGGIIGGGIIRGGNGEAPAFHFTLRKVTGVALDGKAPKEALRATAEDLQATLDAMYLAGFVDPERWEDGEFPEVLEAFAAAAAEGARRDLADLTLGPTYSQIESVEPGRSRLDVEFLLTENRKAFAAVATTTFRARGTLAGGGSVEVDHQGRYVMRPIDGRWVIVSYQVDGRLRPAPPALASPSPPSPEPSP